MKSHTQKITRILSLLLAAAFCILLLQSLLLGFINLRSAIALRSGAGNMTTTLSGITLDYLFLASDSGGIPISNDALASMNLASLTVYLGLNPLLCYGIHLLRKVLAPMAQNRPFSGTGRILKKLGWVSLLAALIHNGSQYAMHTIMEQQFDLPRLFAGSAISTVRFNTSLQWDFVLTALVFFLLSWVFRYGEELQTLSDETL